MGVVNDNHFVVRLSENDTNTATINNATVDIPSSYGTVGLKYDLVLNDTNSSADNHRLPDFLASHDINIQHRTESLWEYLGGLWSGLFKKPKLLSDETNAKDEYSQEHQLPSSNEVLVMDNIVDNEDITLNITSTRVMDASLDLTPIFNNAGDMIGVYYDITNSDGDNNAEVDEDTRWLRMNYTLTSRDNGSVLRSYTDCNVEWRANWTGPRGDYPVPNSVLYGNKFIFPEPIHKSDLVANGNYTNYMPFSYEKAVDDMIIPDYIPGSMENFTLPQDTVSLANDDQVNNNTTTYPFPKNKANDMRIPIFIGGWLILVLIYLRYRRML
jgi:hypothetical protein